MRGLSHKRAGMGSGFAVRLQWATGLLLVVLAVGLRLAFPLEPVFLALQVPGVIAGTLIVVLSGVSGRILRPSAMAAGCVVVTSVVLMILAAEVMSRWMRIDFRRQEQALNRYPPYYRQPRVPSGSVFYRRQGPDEWTGQPIRTWLEQIGSPASEAYREEKTVTIRYDANGFRNERPIADWTIAVAGDSFVELGCLADEDLFTTILGRSTGTAVLNLGASNTGPLTHLHYLESYGLAPGLRTTVIVFYEGNDLADLMTEKRALEHHARTGKRGFRNLRPQSSFLGALREAWLRPGDEGETVPIPEPHKMFLSREGPVQMTLSPFAPHPEAVGAETLNAYVEFLREYADFGRRHRVETWIAYMPCKTRVLRGLLRSAPSSDQDEDGWDPTPLREWVEENCRRQGIQWIDLTPALRRAAEVDGRLPYNGLVETHLNALGSSVVAGELRRVLQP